MTSSLSFSPKPKYYFSQNYIAGICTYFPCIHVYFGRQLFLHFIFLSKFKHAYSYECNIFFLVCMHAWNILKSFEVFELQTQTLALLNKRCKLNKLFLYKEVSCFVFALSLLQAQALPLWLPKVLVCLRHFVHYTFSVPKHCKAICI